MADLAAIRQQIADAMNTLPEMRATPYIPDQVQPPAVIVEPDYVDWDAGGMARGAEHWYFLIRVLIGLANNTAAQKNRDEYLGGGRDIKDAVQAAMPNSSVSSARKFDAWTYAGVDYLGVEFAVLVIA